MDSQFKWADFWDSAVIYLKETIDTVPLPDDVSVTQRESAVFPLVI